MYYLAFSNEINGYLNNGKSLTAQRLANEQLRVYRDNNDCYGQYVVMKTLGGKVGIYPEYDKGSRFYLMIPVK